MSDAVTTATGAHRIGGVWAALPSPWTAEDRIDSGLVTELVRRYASAGLDGAYTTGTDGEMHVMELEDFRSLIDGLAAGSAETGLPVQAGCTAQHTRAIADRIRYAADRGVTIAQFALPGWVTLGRDEVLSLFADLAQAAPHTAFVHYNIALTGRMLTGSDYRDLLAVCPNLIGSKQTGGMVPEFIEVTQNSPTLAHFVVDAQIVPAAMFGAAGFYSFLANLSPRFVVTMWRACRDHDWERAAELRAVAERFLRAWRADRPSLGTPALAKIATRAGIMPELPLRVRGPYAFGSDDDVADLRRLVAHDFPEME